MATRRKPPTTPRPEDSYLPGDPIPTAEAIEKNTDTAWALWAELADDDKIRFADTVPVTVPGAMAPPLPATAGRPNAHTPALGRTVGIAELLQEARRSNRVCPQEAQWQQLYQMLLARSGKGAGAQPTPPLIGTAWQETPALAKRMCFRDHLEWAATRGCIDEVFGFLKRLPEEHWYHMGE